MLELAGWEDHREIKWPVTGALEVVENRFGREEKTKAQPQNTR